MWMPSQPADQEILGGARPSALPTEYRFRLPVHVLAWHRPLLHLEIWLRISIHPQEKGDAFD